MKILAVLIAFVFAVPLLACSCFPAYQSLPDAICEYEQNDFEALEIRLVRQAETGSFFRVERVLTGEIDEIEIFIQAGDGASCGLPVELYPVGSRYLYFAGNWEVDQELGYTFACSYLRNIYELNGNSTRIKYMTSRTGESFPGPLAWMNYRTALQAADCDVDPGPEIPANPLNDLVLTNNPGNGIFRLWSRVDSFPLLDKLEVYDLSGKYIYQETIQSRTPGDRRDMSKLPSGVYAIVLKGDNWRKTFRYVKAR